MIEDRQHFEHVAQAFSYKADIYDEFGKDHPNLERMRQKVYAHVLRFLPSGARILEINAGTGTDAAFFAKQGYFVHATDISPGMIASISEKIERFSLQSRLTAELRSYTDLSGVKGKPFDFIFSNFGGLNCIDDLSLVACQLPILLKPGGRLTWVIMPPVCPWELAQVFKGDFKTAFRRLRPSGIQANVEGIQFHVNYFTPRQVLDAFGEHFRLLELEGLSVLTPPADHKDFALQSPVLYNLLVRLDDIFTTLLPWGWGDFYILTAEYRL